MSQPRWQDIHGELFQWHQVHKPQAQIEARIGAKLGAEGLLNLQDRVAARIDAKLMAKGSMQRKTRDCTARIGAMLMPDGSLIHLVFNRRDHWLTKYNLHFYQAVGFLVGEGGAARSKAWWGEAYSKVLGGPIYVGEKDNKLQSPREAVQALLANIEDKGATDLRDRIKAASPST